MNTRAFGWILLALAIAASFEQIRAGVPHVILAFCYIGIFVAAVGFLTRRVELVYAYVAVALIAQVPFSIDLARVYLDMPQLIGLVDYDPAWFSWPSRIIDLTVHLSVLPLAIIGLTRLNPAPYARFISTYSILAALLFVLSFTLTGSNCTRVGCFDTLPFGDVVAGHLFYASLVWFVLPLIAGYGLVRAHAWYATSRQTSSR